MVNRTGDRKAAIGKDAAGGRRLTTRSLYSFRPSSILPWSVLIPYFSLLLGQRGRSFDVSGGGDVFTRIPKWGQRLFTQRQILVKSDGRISYVTLTRRAQMAMALGGVAAVALIGCGVATLSLERRSAEWRGAATAGVAAQDVEPEGLSAVLQRQIDTADAQSESEEESSPQAEAPALDADQASPSAQPPASVPSQAMAQAEPEAPAPTKPSLALATAATPDRFADARQSTWRFFGGGSGATERERAAAERDDLNRQIASLQQARDQAITERDDLRRQVNGLQTATSDKSAHLSRLAQTLDTNRGELRQ